MKKKNKSLDSSGTAPDGFFQSCFEHSRTNLSALMGKRQIDNEIRKLLHIDTGDFQCRLPPATEGTEDNISNDIMQE